MNRSELLVRVYLKMTAIVIVGFVGFKYSKSWLTYFKTR